MPRDHPENTLPGFALALEAGVQGIELDVHATGDGVVVVHHDPTVSGLAVASAGGSAQRISALPLEELRSLEGGRAIPTLEEVLALVDGRARVYVEVKASGMEELVIGLLKPRVEWCGIHSFDHRIVAKIHGAVPALRCGVLMSSYLLHPLGPLQDTGALDLWQHWSMIDEPLVEQVHAHGGRVIAWTVNDVSTVRLLRGWGVDGMCTDVGRELMSAIRH